KQQCMGQGVTRRGTGGNQAPTPDAAPPPPLPPPTLAANGCMAKDEVEDGCCNPAVSDPVLDGGVCCWTFCEGACCGRPIRAMGVPIVAAPAPRGDWIAGHVERRSAIDPVTRRALHDAFVADALTEHASVASFAVLTLELLALGAPPDLVTCAQAAA